MKLFHIFVREKITCKNELQHDGKAYFSCEYNKIRGKMTQIGVKVTAAEVIVRQFGQNVLALIYDNQSDIWYHGNSTWIENDFKRKTDGIFGINVGGSFEVVALDHAGVELDKVSVNITPGTMSIEEYKIMQQEVRHLFEVFSYDLSDDAFQESNLLRRVQMPLFPLTIFQKLIFDVETIFHELNERPEVELRQFTKKVHVKDVRKWTPALIIEDALKQRGKVTAVMNEQVTDIRENRMIKFMMDEYVNRAKIEIEAEQRQLQLFQLEIDELNLMLSQTFGELRIKPLQLLDVLVKDCELLEHRIKQWKGIIQTLKEIMDNSILQVDSEQPEETHLFRMHPHYSELYNLYLEYEKLLPELTDTFRFFIQSLLKSPTLYEVWVLLKIVQHLTQWGLNPKEFVSDLEQNYIQPNTHEISGYRKLFVLPDRPFDLAIYFDYTFLETGYRPDFVIGFKNNQTLEWSFHSLDVKYKNYSAMKNSRENYLTDMERSAYRYLQELLRPQNMVKSATLVHLDKSSTHWNTKPANLIQGHGNHKLAHFMLSPLHSKNLSIYFKRLLHEGSEYENCCPSCGKERLGERKKFPIIYGRGSFGKDKHRWKTLYTCDECNELWVANFCSDCSFNNRNYLVADYNAYDYPRPLYKYPTNNYNMQVEDEWEVHCPTCNRLSHPERPYHFTDDDYFGPTVVY